MRLKEIKYLVVHCSDTPDERDVSVADIHDMHLGFGWDGIGYHKLITRDGTVHNGCLNSGRVRMYRDRTITVWGYALLAGINLQMHNLPRLKQCC